MRTPGWLAVILLTCGVARADLGSTADEWAARFLPEAGDGLMLPEYANGIDRVNADLDAGQYRRALSDLAAIPSAAARVTDLLRPRALLGLGETEDALRLLTHWPYPVDNAKDLLLAQVYLDQANPVRALTTVQAVVDRLPGLYAARLLRGQALEAAGRFKDAIDAYHWFLEPPQDLLHKWQTDPADPDAFFGDAAAVTCAATAIHRWATLTGAYKDTPQLNDTVLAMYTRAFDVIDRQNIPARVAAAKFCLSRGDTERADGLLKPLQARAGHNRDVLGVLADLAVAEGSESAMHSVADTLRDEDPDSVDAALLEIVALTRARAVAADDRAQRLYARHPDRPDVAGAAAALAYINGRPARLDQVLNQADTVYPTRSDAYVEAAGLLAAAFQRDAAAGVLKTAIARTPWEAAPYHLLGDLYLNDGYNDQAHAVLDQAFALDPYNVKTLNYLRLLDDLAKYDQRVSAHFIIYSDKDADPIAADQIGPYMEQCYDDLTKTFDYVPKTKIVVQIYPEDDAFSVRMAGVPGVENFGVSFGRVLATIAPRRGTKQGNFNWSRVLRHEFVHTINLLQTDEHCPRWLTEGLAVWQEHVPFRFAAVPRELYKRTFADDLFSIRGFPLAYIRPTRPDDGEQAYTQGAYLAMYLDETFGTPSIVKLLTAYGRGHGDEDAFRSATGEPMAKFEADWHAWMKHKLAPWGYDAATNDKVAALEKEGEEFLHARNFPEALKSWQAACDLQPTEVKPQQRLAGLYLQKSIADPAKAIEHLKFLHVLELQDDRYAKQITRLYIKLNDPENAAHWARQATYVDLYDASAHNMLSDLERQLGHTDEANTEQAAAAQIRLWDQKRASAGQ